MPLTYINHKKATLSKDELTQLGKEFNRINSKLSGPGDEEVFFYTQQMEEPNKSEPIEVFIRLSKHLTDKRGGLAAYADEVAKEILLFKPSNSISYPINVTV